ncbi:MAG: hypothetical protein HC872_04925, partial [Gammaproteobacteria bacterium]|nr:hypothetical protein [Gammaproteobacteria bacterium]
MAEFSIPPQSLESALLAFADQAGVQVSVSALAVAGIRTRGVYGRHPVGEALARLLAETGLQYNVIGERTYSVA